MDYEVKRVSPWSALRVATAIYAVFGMILGLLIGLLGSDAAFGGPVIGFLGGLIYGIFAGGISALAVVAYNLVARVVGGIRVELRE